MQLYIKKLIIGLSMIFMPASMLNATELLNKTNITEIEGTQTYYTIAVPENSTALKVRLSNVTGDPDLYVRYGEQPTNEIFDCRPYSGQNTDETCNMDNPQAGTWYIMIDAYHDFSGANLIAEVDVILPSSPSSLSVEASANGYLTVTGTADPRTGVKATFPDQSVAYDTAAADGSFSIVSLHPQESGTISLVAIDLPGNSSTVSTIAYVKHAAPPAGSLNIPNITETHGTQKYYTIDVPANSTALNVLLSNITGDPDLYVRYGEKPTKQAYDCRPYESPNTDETCNMDNPQAGTWHIMIDAYKDFSGATLTANVEGNTPPQAGGLNIPNITETQGTKKYYTIDVPANSTALNVLLSNITGDPDMYVRYGEKPTKQAYDCRPFKSPNTDETCNMDNPQAGTWHIMIDAYKDFSGATLTATVR